MMTGILLCGVAGSMMSFCVVWGLCVSRRIWNGRMARWCEGDSSRLCRTWTGKYVRDRATGAVGLCVGAGFASFRGRFGFAVGREVVQLIVCPNCAVAVMEGRMHPMVVVCNRYCSRILPIVDVVPALADEVREFKAKQGGAES